MKRPIRPVGVAPPAAAYELGMLSEGTRTLHTAGIVGIRPNGTIASDVGAQAGEIWRTIGILLEEAGMKVTDIVSVTSYVVAGQDLGPVMEARDTFMSEHRSASTLITVPQLVRPEWLMEVSVVANA